jgi:hypothetical protein
MTTTTDVAKVPMPIEVGPEMEALWRFYPDVSWSGTISEGGMGPGTPRMHATGQGTHEIIQDGRWIVGTYAQDQFLDDGTFVLRWQLHWAVGWVPDANRYQATMADNYGRVGVMTGWIEGDRLIFESVEGSTAPIRLIWDISDPQVITWRNEMAVGEDAWFLIEEYRMAPM